MAAAQRPGFAQRVRASLARFISAPAPVAGARTQVHRGQDAGLALGTFGHRGQGLCLGRLVAGIKILGR